MEVVAERAAPMMKTFGTRGALAGPADCVITPAGDVPDFLGDACLDVVLAEEEEEEEEDCL